MHVGKIGRGKRSTIISWCMFRAIAFYLFLSLEGYEAGGREKTTCRFGTRSTLTFSSAALLFLQSIPCAARSLRKLGWGCFARATGKGTYIKGSSSSEAHGLTASTNYSYVFRLFSAYVHPGVIMEGMHLARLTMATR